MAANIDTDDPIDPRARWESYQVPEPPRDITCDCGATIPLPVRGLAVCAVCGNAWDRFGQLVATVWPPR